MHKISVFDQIDILIILLHNLKELYIKSYLHNYAVYCIDMILALRPNSPIDVRDKGISEEMLSNRHNSLILLKYYLELEPDAHDIDYIIELMRDMREKISL